MIVAEIFWKEPSVYDVLGVVGVLISVGSVWYAWWLAKRDLTLRISQATQEVATAARNELRRIAMSHVAVGLHDVIRWLELAREANKAKRWQRSGELCQLAGEKLADILGQPSTAGVRREELRPLTLVIREFVAKLEKQSRQGTGTLPSPMRMKLDEAIETLNRINGSIRGIQMEDLDG